MALIGYARTSTKKQNIESQINELKKYGCIRIFTDQKSGKSTERTGLEEMLDYVREGDKVVVYKLDRLARSIVDLKNISDILQQKGVELVSITQNIDTSSPMGRMVFNMIGVFAEFEREMIVERVNQGIQNAKDSGVKLGRKKANKVLLEKAYELYQSGNYTMKQIVKETGVSRATVYRYIEEMSRQEPA